MRGPVGHDRSRTLTAAAWEQVSAGIAWAAAALPAAPMALWVQALGSVLAILWSVRVMRRQNRAALELADRADIARGGPRRPGPAPLRPS
jgi:hypothetical protein